MLIICYGITKSGSTLAFELVKGMLESVGHPQTRLSDDVILPQHGINFVQRFGTDHLKDLLKAVGDRWVAVKTHASPPYASFRYLDELQQQGRVCVIASYRDPRDICLSLIDAGTRARAKNRRAFAEVSGIPDAVRGVLRQIPKFRRWGALTGTLPLNYELVAFSPDKAISLIEERLGIKCDREYAKRHAFQKAFTQKNKALPHRSRNELPSELYEELTKTFSDFLQNACGSENQAWFASERDAVLARLEKARRRQAARRGKARKRNREDKGHRRKKRARKLSARPA